MRHDVTLLDPATPPPAPVGPALRLRPLTDTDFGPLLELMQATPDEWAWMGSPPTRAEYFQTALDAPDALPFVVEVQGESGWRLAGTTRLGTLSRPHRAAEIGWTALAPALHGSGANRRMKRLLLAYAFEELWDGLGCVRVQLRTDARNLRSQRAIEKLGAVREGVLRSHMITASGYVRDTVMYSVTRQEWPEVKARLAD